MHSKPGNVFYIYYKLYIYICIYMYIYVCIYIYMYIYIFCKPILTNNIFYWFVYFVVIFYSTRLFLTCCFAAFTLRILYVICIIYVLKFAFNVLVYDILAKHAFLLCHDFSFRRPSKTPAKRLWWSTHYIYISLHIHIYVCICIYIYILYIIYIYIY